MIGMLEKNIISQLFYSVLALPAPFVRIFQEHSMKGIIREIAQTVKWVKEMLSILNR